MSLFANSKCFKVQNWLTFVHLNGSRSTSLFQDGLNNLWKNSYMKLIGILFLDILFVCLLQYRSIQKNIFCSVVRKAKQYSSTRNKNWLTFIWIFIIICFVSMLNVLSCCRSFLWDTFFFLVVRKLSVASPPLVQ